MDNKYLISQYANTGVRIPKYQMHQLSPNQLKSYLRVRVIAATQEPDDLRSYEIKLIPEEELNKITINLDYTILKDWFFYTVLHADEDENALIFALLENNLFKSKLDYETVELILENTNEPDKVISILLNNEGFVSKLDNDMIQIFFQSSINLTDTINKLGKKGIEFISYLEEEDIGMLLRGRDYQRIEMLLNNKYFINNLTLDTLDYLLNEYTDNMWSKESHKFIKRLTQNETLINKLFKIDGIELLINYYSMNGETEITPLLGQRGEDYLTSKQAISQLKSITEYIRTSDIPVSKEDAVRLILKFVKDLNAKDVKIALNNPEIPEEIKSVIKLHGKI